MQLTDSPPESGAGCLRVSIVSYASPEPQLQATVNTLLSASRICLSSGRLRAVDIFMVDNGPAKTEQKKIEAIIASATKPDGIRLVYCGTGQNIGFGAGHNLTFDVESCEFHLVLNPDVELAPESLCAAFDFMMEHGDCGAITPAVVNQLGDTEYLCKRYPTVLDLLLRGFAPTWLRSLFRRRLDNYEMRDVLGDKVVWSPPLISGCFMLLRSSLVAQLKGFSIDYFLYFEDYDLSLRAAEITRIAYVPTVRVVHHGGYAARKGWRHIVLFVRSSVTFFNRYGWRWC